MSQERRPSALVLRLEARLFSKPWRKLHPSTNDPLADDYLKYPGVYLLAYTNSNIEGNRVDVSEVFYVGMSAAKAGLMGRLKEFRRGIENGKVHSGAIPFFTHYANGTPFSRLKSAKRFYFTALTLPCTSDKATATPKDWRTMGHVKCLEDYAMARIVKRTCQRPNLNIPRPAETKES